MSGSATVTQRAGEFIAGRFFLFLSGFLWLNMIQKVKLQGSKFESFEEIKHITDCFDVSTKRLFRDNKEPMHVKFGSPRDKDLERGIRSGMLKLSG